MRIKKLDLNKVETSINGLKEFKSSKINNTIALVGKNGSGKTRYLKVIEHKLLNCEFTDAQKDNFNFLPNSIEIQINKNVINTGAFQSLVDYRIAENHINNNPKSKIAEEEFVNTTNRMTKFQQAGRLNVGSYDSLKNLLQKEVTKRVKVIRPDDFRALKASFESNKQSKITFQDIIDSTNENIEIDELSMIGETGLTYLKRLPHKLAYDSIDTRGDEKKFKNRVAYKRFKVLSNLIYEFLGKKLEWKSRTSNVDEHDEYISIQAKGYWTIAGIELNYSTFSDGEKVLFTYALLLFLLNTNPRIKFKESIIIIDEPELNLHPKAQIKLIESLQNLIKDEGQLIIATHSLSIISNLDYGSIYLVREGQLFSPSSTIPFESIDDLMGFDEHYNKIVEFLVII